MGTAHWCWQGETGRQESGLAEEEAGLWPGAQDCSWRNSHWTRVTRSPCGLSLEESQPWAREWEQLWIELAEAAEPPHPILVQNTLNDPWRRGAQRKENLYIYGMWTAKSWGRRDDSFHICKFTGREMCSGSFPTPNGTNHIQFKKKRKEKATFIDQVRKWIRLGSLGFNNKMFKWGRERNEETHGTQNHTGLL